MESRNYSLSRRFFNRVSSKSFALPLIISLEFLLLWVFKESAISFSGALIIHTLICVVWFALRKTQKHRAGSDKVTDFALPSIFFLGPVGAAGILVFYGLFKIYSARATSFDDWYQELFPDTAKSRKEQLIERLLILEREPLEASPDLIPFIDILSSEDRKEKLNVLTLMLRNFHPVFAPAFRAALNDSDNAVRVLAASAITKLEEGFNKENLNLESKLSTHQKDVTNLSKLAKLYDDHWISGISDYDSLISSQKKASRMYQKIFDLMPNSPDILWYWGRLLLRSGSVFEAQNKFEMALQLGEGNADLNHRVWYWECLYLQSRYLELRQEVEQHYNSTLNDKILQRELIESIQSWTCNDEQEILLTGT